VINSLFTVPLVLSSTAEATGQTTFVSLTDASNQTSVLDSTPLITVFIPTNDAFAAANISTAFNNTAALLSAHILPNFAGYLPSLINGSTYTTQDNTSITVSVQGEDYYVNNAKIVSSNLILDNGVAHVIDTVRQIFSADVVLADAVPIGSQTFTNNHPIPGRWLVCRTRRRPAIRPAECRCHDIILLAALSTVVLSPRFECGGRSMNDELHDSASEDMSLH
jgi:hypothetical protein